MLSSSNQPGSRGFFSREEVLQMITSLPYSQFTPNSNGWNMSGCSQHYTVNPELVLQTLEKDLPRGD
jgi:hypothetical protein